VKRESRRVSALLFVVHFSFGSFFFRVSLLFYVLSSFSARFGGGANQLRLNEEIDKNRYYLVFLGTSINRDCRLIRVSRSYFGRFAHH
jgi:hypothetical protein